MRTESTVVVRRPVGVVWRFFDNPDNLRHWLTGFQRFERLSGTTGMPGARSRHFYELNGRTVEMVEDVAVRKEESEFSGSLTNEWMESTIRTVFRDLGANGTEITSTVESRFIPWHLKVIGPIFMKKGFQKRQDSDLRRFKEAVEGI